LPAVTRLRLRATDGQKNACQEIIHIHGTISKEDGMYFDIKPGGYADSGTGVALLDSYACRPRVGKRYTVNESILVED
jgi:hypothetical protein